MSEVMEKTKEQSPAIPDFSGGEKLDLAQIKKALPHRYPMLLVDRIESVVANVGAIGRKCVTSNEPFFEGHFPGHPIMPGVMIVEAMAQTAGICVVHGIKDTEQDNLVYFMTIDKARFRAPVLPGDVLELHVWVTKSRGAIWKFRGEAKVDGKVVAEAEFGAMIR
jgi:3-hydroxyacyl-[acyl-carrier-protein] dehydratase